MACTSDFSGLVRGKGFARADLDRKVAGGIGWTPTNVQITCFDTIAESPYGALGDLVLRPDPSTLVEAALPDGTAMSFLLGDIADADGAPWACCTRSLLASAVDRLRAATGLTLRASFEHEFMMPYGRGSRAFTLAGFLERQPFGEALFSALAAAGIAPDSFLREYGPDQMEITLPPAEARRAADEAVIVREATRAVARAMGLPATFTPLLSPEMVGNGVHVHLSLWDAEGRPMTHDPDGQDGLSGPASAFVAGILAHLNAVSAFTAPSAISFARLTPHKWSAAFNNLGRQDREAALRICPVTARNPKDRARQFHVEFRAADAAASPHLALAALIHAGLLGIEAGLTAAPATTEDLSLLSPADLAARGFAPLPDGLEAALAALAEDALFRATWPGDMVDIYIAHKTGELAHVAGLAADERHAAYAATY